MNQQEIKIEAQSPIIEKDETEAETATNSIEFYFSVLSKFFKFKIVKTLASELQLQ